jgi:hypothetical protein
MLFPLDRDPGRFQHPLDGGGDFRTDAIALDQGDGDGRLAGRCQSLPGGRFKLLGHNKKSLS